MQFAVGKMLRMQRRQSIADVQDLCARAGRQMNSFKSHYHVRVELLVKGMCQWMLKLRGIARLFPALTVS